MHAQAMNSDFSIAESDPAKIGAGISMPQKFFSRSAMRVGRLWTIHNLAGSL